MKTSDDTIPGADPRIDFFDELADEWDVSGHES